jgi:hypothetical protein
MLTEEVMDAVFDAIPDDLPNSDVAALLATIASAYSENKDCNTAMHLNTARSYGPVEDDTRNADLQLI